VRYLFTFVAAETAPVAGLTYSVKHKYVCTWL